MNADTGAILLEKDAYEKRYPASTTKIATALYILKTKRHHLQDSVIAEKSALLSSSAEEKKKSLYQLPAYLLEPDGTTIGLVPGEEMTVLDLLKASLIHSGNDATNVLAQHLEGSIPAFMDQLNLYLKELGCKDTHFCNPHGLHHPEHQSTAYDLALISKEALKDPLFCEIISQTRFIKPKTNKQKATTYLHTNRLLRPGKYYYPKAIGIKTGYHSKAKHNFVGAARLGSRTLILVLMGYPKRNLIFEDAIGLFEAAFNQPKIKTTFLTIGQQEFSLNLDHADRPLKTVLTDEVSLEYYPAEDPKPRCLLFWNTPTLPIRQHQKVGVLQLVDAQNRILKQVSLFAQTDVDFAWPYSWMHHLKKTPLLYLIGLALSLAIFLVTLTRFLRVRGCLESSIG